MKKTSSNLFVLLLLAVISPFFVQAEGLDFIVGPAKNELDIAGGETKSVEILITNRLGVNENFSISLSSLETDKLGNLIVSEKPNSLNVSVPEKININSGASKTINVKVSVPKNHEPGSVAFGVFVEPKKFAVNELTSHSRIGVINIVKISGEVKESGLFEKLSISDKKIVRMDDTAPLALDFSNTGNVHLNPYGIVIIKNVFGKEVHAQKIDPWYVMPNSSRTREISLSTTNFFGRYTATVILNRGYGDQVDSKTVAFYVVPFFVPVVLVIILVGLIFFFIKRGFLNGVLVAGILLAGVVNVHAQMSSTNYKVQFDSVNVGGGLSSSTNYRQESTVGEIATGEISSANYNIHAGYQQMNEVYLAITNAADVNLTPNLGSVSGGTANGSTNITVTTDGSAGYSLYVNASTSPALASGTDSFADYAPSGANPDFSFSFLASQSFFGFSPEGTDVVSQFLDNGSSCGVGATDTSDSCWDGFATTTEKISEKTSANTPAGTATSLKLRAGAGASRNQQAGNYEADITFTALAL